MSGAQQGPGSAAAPRRALSYFADVGAGLRRSYDKAWMITFADLIALMLTFFVLLFAMSQVEQQKWQNLVRSLDDNMDTIRKREGAKPAIEFQVDGEAPVPGADLDYLAPIVHQQIASDPSLAPSVIRRLPDRLVISLPAALLYAPEGSNLTPAGERVGFSIGGVLRNLRNVIEVEAHTAPSAAGPGEPAGWELSLARAAALTAMLAKAGYDGPVVARGFGETRPGDLSPHLNDEEKPTFADRIDIVIHERAREGP
ncbi:MAG: flagellar motor protein MotB [Kiloniellaceae bacterium]